MVVPVHTIEYDRYLEYQGTQKQSEKLNRDYCVVLDNDQAFDPLAKTLNIPLVEPDNYFKAMNNLFDKIERELGLKVIVAAHPRSTYEKRPGLFGQHEIVKGRTLELVADSSLVVTHDSTSVSYAVMFEKPILVAATSDMNDYVYVMSNALGVDTVTIDDDAEMKKLDLAKYIEPNAKYEDYLFKNIKSRQAPEKKLWQVVETNLMAL